MRQNEISLAPGSRKKSKRVGRGDASGHGSYSGKGQKGQKARSGLDISPRFEGGQTPLVKRLPHTRGFNNKFRVEYTAVNLHRLDSFGNGAEVTPEGLLAAGVVSSLTKPIKVLGDGDIKVSLVVKAHKFSGTARQKIEAAGGKAEEIGKKGKK